NKILNNYIKRDTMAGRFPGLMNIEELATIWHFPHEGVVKAPLIQKAPGRKAEPPMTLPQAEEIVGQEKAEPLFLGELREEIGEANPVVKKEKTLVAEAEPEEPEEERPSFATAMEDKGAPPENLPFV
ncbi:MAG: hypothetical protein PHR36_04635, partial [Patescibacteria group bacterium]|nr:hypothetical protein [Patescibacteria group bacterium]